MDVDSDTTHEQLKLADQLLREGRSAEAIEKYELAASAYLLSAAVVRKFVVQIIDNDPTSLSAHARPALHRLLEAYRALDLESEVQTIEARVRELDSAT